MAISIPNGRYVAVWEVKLLQYSYKFITFILFATAISQRTQVPVSVRVCGYVTGVTAMAVCQSQRQRLYSGNTRELMLRTPLIASSGLKLRVCALPNS